MLWPKKEKAMKLNKYANNITSQHGEDGILKYILENLPHEINKICMEFGAWDGKHLSNTYSLWHDQGWRGILIEADSAKCQRLKESYSDYDTLAFNQFVEPEGDGSIDALFRKHGIDPNVGIVSIDINSTDFYVWKNMEYVNPAIVVVEHNQTIPAYIEYVDPEGEVFLRCSAKALETLGRAKGYKLICCTVTNSIFIRDDLFDASKFPDMPVEYLFDYSHCTPPQLQIALGVHESQYIPIFYGEPTLFQKYAYPFCYRLFSLIKGSGYKKPSATVLNACKKSGIFVE